MRGSSVMCASDLKDQPISQSESTCDEPAIKLYKVCLINLRLNVKPCLSHGSFNGACHHGEHQNEEFEPWH
jgi:hypothetical protein